jgi:hypothetical protein
VIKTTLIVSLFALAPGAYPATISSFNISTTAQGGTPCSMSGSGPGTATCSSTGTGPGGPAAASVTMTDNSIQLEVGAFQGNGAQAFASITHDDFYSVPVNGPVSEVVSLTCATGFAIGTIGHFSLGSTNVSPPVETIWLGASQGSGPCGNSNQIAALPPSFVVSLSATNNIVHLHTYIDASGSEGDNDTSIFVQLKVDGFEDANGNPITATLLPEPGTLGTFALALLAGVIGLRAKRKPN